MSTRSSRLSRLIGPDNSIANFLVRNPVAITVQSLIVFFLVWHIAGDIYGLSNILSTPTDVAIYFVDLMISLEWVPHYLRTLRRVAISYILGMGIGIFVALLLGFTDFWEAVLKDIVVGWLSLPTALVVVFAAMWWGRSEFTIIVPAVLTIFAFPAQMVYEGIRDVPDDLVEMARSYEISQRRIAWRIAFRSVMPQVVASARQGFTGAFAVATLAEVIVAEVGIGYMLQRQMLTFHLEGIITWTLLVTGSLIIWEYVFLQQIESMLFAYRTEVEGIGGRVGGER